MNVKHCLSEIYVEGVILNSKSLTDVLKNFKKYLETVGFSPILQAFAHKIIEN